MTFINENFLLNSESAKTLYHDYAKDMPIFDFHCHLDPKEIAENKKYRNMTEIWLSGDHYKWRALRSNGVDEKYITGESSDYDKFRAWAETVRSTVGNPLYHWTHLELKRYFDEDKLLNAETCDEIWNDCNEKLQSESLSAQNIIKNFKVNVICTTDDPTSDLKYHQAIKENNNIDTRVLPTFRPDQALEVNKPSFTDYVHSLSQTVDHEINTYSDLLRSLTERIHYFHEIGGRVSDHSFEQLPFEECTFEEASVIFAKRKKGQFVTSHEEDQYKTYTMLSLGQTYASLGWVMQMHLGALRNNNSRMFDRLGADTGFDSMGDAGFAKPLNQMLNALDKDNQLPKTIIYNVNPMYNDVVASAVGNFQTGGIKGKVQFGSGWWYNDQKDGILKQLTSLANIGLLSNFVGMLTDSRSFLSYTRHEYFRRVLCDLFGNLMEKGEMPEDYKLIGGIVQDICYNNAQNYFDLQ